GGYRHLPVVDADGKPTGIISVRDILRYLEEKQAMVG
ncbi:MAG: CBS domain-containing protein, partial [Planctomycetales bacterium]|nr:CBS domain-containing protein [Planctomycetales bacterium]